MTAECKICGFDILVYVFIIFNYFRVTRAFASQYEYRPLILQIKNPAQLDAALAFLGTVGPETFKLNEFEEACGIGIILMTFLMMLIMDVY